jgi:hypothetical protein
VAVGSFRRMAPSTRVATEHARRYLTGETAGTERVLGMAPGPVGRTAVARAVWTRQLGRAVAVHRPAHLERLSRERCDPEWRLTARPRGVIAPDAPRDDKGTAVALRVDRSVR